MSEHNIPEDILAFLVACVVVSLLLAASWLLAASRSPQQPHEACELLLPARIACRSPIAKDSTNDAPRTPAACALYFTHEHVDAKSYQLTCRDPQPDSVVLYPKKASETYRGGDTLPHRDKVAKRSRGDTMPSSHSRPSSFYAAAPRAFAYLGKPQPIIFEQQSRTVLTITPDGHFVRGPGATVDDAARAIVALAEQLWGKGRSACRDPQPDSITLYPKRESAVWRGGDTLQ